MRPVVSRKRSQHFAKAWQLMDATASPARAAAPKSSAFATQPTKPTTARAARPEVSFWPTVRSADCCARIGRVRSRKWKKCVRPGSRNFARLSQSSEKRNHRWLLVASLASDFVHYYCCRHGNVERRDLAQHRNGNQEIAFLADLLVQAVAFRAQHQSAVHQVILLIVSLGGAFIQPNRPDVARLEILDGPSDVGD